MFHVFAYNRYGSQSAFHLHRADFTHFDFLGEFLVQQGACQFGLSVSYTDGNGVLGRSLRNQEHADAVLGQRTEQTVVHSDDTHHAQTGHGNQTRIVDGRDTLDGLREMVGLLLDDGSRSVRIERILDENRNILVAHRIDSRRINHLRAEVTELHRLHVAQFRYRISRTDDARVGRHEAVHIGPDFKDIGFQRGRNDGSGIIGTSPAQVRNLTGILVAGNESGHHRHLRKFPESFLHQLGGQFRIQDMSVMLLFGLDEST